MNDHDTDSGLAEAECPFCGVINESCKHLIATFGVSEPGVEGGLLADHLDEVLELMGAQPIDEAATEEGTPLDLDEITASLRAYLEHHDEVSWADFSVEEGEGIWDYANYWARYPGMVIDDLYRQIEERG